MLTNDKKPVKGASKVFKPENYDVRIISFSFFLALFLIVCVKVTKKRNQQKYKQIGQHLFLLHFLLTPESAFKSHGFCNCVYMVLQFQFVSQLSTPSKIATYILQTGIP